MWLVLCLFEILLQFSLFYIYVHYCVLFSSRLRVRVRVSVWLISSYAHVLVCHWQTTEWTNEWIKHKTYRVAIIARSPIQSTCCCRRQRKVVGTPLYYIVTITTTQQQQQQQHEATWSEKALVIMQRCDSLLSCWPIVSCYRTAPGRFGLVPATVAKLSRREAANGMRKSSPKFVSPGISSLRVAVPLRRDCPGSVAMTTESSVNMCA